MSIHRGKDKEDVVHIYNGILLSHKKNEFESVLVKRVNLEPVKQSVIGQQEQNKYNILKHIYGIQKNGIDEPICRDGMEMKMQRMDLQTQWEKEIVVQMEKVASTYIHYHM